LTLCIRNTEAYELSLVAVGPRLWLIRAPAVILNCIVTRTATEPPVSEVATDATMSNKAQWVKKVA
jgi:hypothetical protein